MDAQAKIIRPATAAEALPLLALAIADDVQHVGLDEIVAGCQFFMLNNGQFAYALASRGEELWVQAAGGRGGDDLTKLGLAAIEHQANGKYRSVGFQTRRNGLVKKAGLLGYKVDGYILRKML